MRIKRFVAKSLPEAVSLIKAEFGINAVILSQREAPGEVEVTAGVREEDLPGQGGARPMDILPLALPGEPGPKGRAPADADAPAPLGAPPQAKAAGGKIQVAGQAIGECRQAAGPAGAPQGVPQAAPKPRPATGGPPAKAREALPGPASLPTGGARPGGPSLPARELRPAAAGIGAYGRAGAPAPAPGEGLDRQLGDLRTEMEDRLGELKTMLLDLAHRQSLQEKWRDQGDLVRLYRALLGTGLPPGHARDFVEMAAASREAWGGTLIGQLRQTVRPMVKCLSPARAVPRLISVIGPSGAGKTSTIMRLSAHLRQKGRKVALISLDTLKLGAAEQLAQFARIMGLGLKVAQGAEEFMEARELFRPADHVLVDTSTRDFLPGPGRKGLAQALAGAGAMGLLALPAPTKAEDLAAAWKAASGPFLWGVALTKLDETRALGNVLDFVRSEGPVFAYFSNGHKAPEDFFEAGADRLLELWLKPVISETGDAL